MTADDRACLLPRLEAAADRGRGVTFLDEHPERVEWARLHDDATRAAGWLQAAGIGPGERVALLGTTSRALVTAIEAVWLAGAAITVLPLRTRLTPEAEYAEETRLRTQLAEAKLALVDPDLANVFEGAGGDLAVEPLTTMLSGGGGSARYERPPDDPDAVAVLQFTSGSTADPKGVVIPHRCVTANLDALGQRAPIDADDDVVVSWCPLYHDMGLVYLATNTMINGTEFAISSPQHFIASPGQWMEWMSARSGTWTIGPNFSLAIAERILRSGSSKVDLSACRRLGNGAEPIDPDVMERFAATASGFGFDPDALYGAYGMAEATVVISAPQQGTGFTVDTIDGEALEHEHVAAAVGPDHPNRRRLARCGPPVPGLEVRIAEPDTGAIVGERRLGELEVRGHSVVPGYYQRPDATAATFRDGWLRTGDLGYLAEGDVVICGRLKDVIIVGGRNIFPQDLERAAEAVAGVRPGNIIAFGTEGRRGHEGIVVVAEVKDGDVEAVRDEIARAVREESGVRPDDVVLLRPGTLPKTTSGKLRRSLCRARYTRSELDAF